MSKKTVIICDRCGNTCVGAPIQIELPASRVLGTHVRETDDLCEDCAEAMKAFLNGETVRAVGPLKANL